MFAVNPADISLLSVLGVLSEASGKERFEPLRRKEREGNKKNRSCQMNKHMEKL